MRLVTFPEHWRGPRVHERWHHEPGPEAQRFAGLLRGAGIRVDGTAPWDIQVRDERFYRRVFAEGALGLGESYMDGWWESGSLDEFFHRARRAHLDERLYEWGFRWLAIKSRFLNLQSRLRARMVAKEHYDLGNDLYEAMLDPTMQYTCGYWPGVDTLEAAQWNKLDLIGRKLGLAPGMRVLELGGGFGGLAQYLARERGCAVVSYNISEEQVAFGRGLCRGLPVRFELKDYREARREREPFDRVVAVGLCEHIGHKNHRVFLETAHAALAPRGLFLLHTIGGNRSYTYTDPWIDKYIFPNGAIPSIAQLGQAMEGLWVVEDWHNFGPDYDRTLMSWWERFDHGWPQLRARYGDRFYRMWKYYLLASAGAFRARSLQLWQIVLSKGDIPSYTPVR